MLWNHLIRSLTPIFTRSWRLEFVFYLVIISQMRDMKNLFTLNVCDSSHSVLLFSLKKQGLSDSR